MTHPDSPYASNIAPAHIDIAGALSRINTLTGTPLTLFIADDKGMLLGSVTDGDIRRGLLAGHSLTEPVEAIMKRDCIRLLKGAADLDTFSRARNLGIALLPVVDEAGCICDIVNLRLTRSLLPLDAVLMAGGRGERLRPLTLDTPKPLLPVGGKPIIDYNIDALRSFGIRDIYVTVNYLREQIQAHFESDAHIHCITEPAPLGTFGSVGLIHGLKHDNILVMNSDLLTTLNFEKMYRHHISSGADLTMAAIPYSVSVPYAILSIDDDRVRGFEEKPTFNYFANAGVYILKRETLHSVDGSCRIDATDFIDSLLADGRKVSYFPIDGTWIDIGSPDDYRMACKKMS